MPVPQNAKVIWDFLKTAGLSDNAAAGILGNIEQESGGSPTAGSMSSGYGLIQWTPGTQYFHSPPSLQQQLPAIISYIKANGSVSDINSHASSASEAALYFSSHYERPLASAANNANREQSANDVLAAAKSGKWPSGGGSGGGGGGGSNPLGGSLASGIGGLLSWPTEIVGFFTDAQKFIDKLMWLVNPASWVRIAAFLGGVFLLLFAAHAFIAAGSGSPIVSMPNVVPIPV